MAARRTAFDWVLEAGTLLMFAGMFLWLLVHWMELPESVPKHYNAAGEPDAWGSKGGLWLLPMVGAGLYAWLTLIGNLPELKGMMRRLLAVVKLAMMGTFAYITWSGVSVALGRSQGLGVGFLPAMLAVSILPALYYCLKLRRFRQ